MPRFYQIKKPKNLKSRLPNLPDENNFRKGSFLRMMIFRTNFSVFILLLIASFVVQAAEEKAIETRDVVVLDFIDLEDGEPKPELSDAIRRQLSEMAYWNVMSPDSIKSRLNHYGLTLDPCNDIQCSFDVGDIVKSDFVLYGTVATTHKYNTINIKFLDVSTARVVWTHTSEGVQNPGISRTRNLERAIFKGLQQLQPQAIATIEQKSKGSLAVIDFSENIFLARVLFERLSTHSFGIRAYEPMNNAEMNELIEALEIDKRNTVPNKENMVELGKTLGVSALIVGKLIREEGEKFRYQISLFDVEKNQLVLDFPGRPSQDFRNLLDYESSFFEKLEQAGIHQPLEMRENPKKINAGLWVSLGLLGIGGATALWITQTEDGASQTEPNWPPRPPEP